MAGGRSGWGSQLSGYPAMTSGRSQQSWSSQHPEKVATRSHCLATARSCGLELGVRCCWGLPPKLLPGPPQVLIPVFALGRAQELCILLETFW